MKNSSEWNRQPNVDQAADAILAGGKVTLDTITAYQVAARLGTAANPSLYAKFRDWRARCRAAAEPVTVDVPPEVEANIRAIFTRLTDDGVGACLGAVRVVGGSLDRVAMLRVGDAERRADRAEAETADVVAVGERIEAELNVATARIAELEQALADAQRREDRLTGRLDQREADLAAALETRAHVKATTTNAAPDVDAEHFHHPNVVDDRDGGGHDTDQDGSVAASSAGGHGDASSEQADAAPTRQLLLTFAGFEVDDDGDRDAH
ncbi:hypothetical protein M9980_09695 [Sphingomonas donggukensis]|uniref:KfrA N-terminal DNA-binding domain-containing protein n=1 Tax=Sphingomonas donggukensis TaxID=2949093 RepID=A0ABY4TUK2_9SPHN|nr:hypothetical protein [Sphingomonas donggukensis]URW74839.1 hypothetical protein M9980_09695 [Sphingomonas donggukensis]